MRAAQHAVHRPASARLLTIDADGCVSQGPRARWLDHLRSGDVVIANDAATLPASLHGIHRRSGGTVELRLAAWRSPVTGANATFDAVVFGAGDHRTPTEDRPAPPHLKPGDALAFGPLSARVLLLHDHPRFVRVRFDASAATFWRGLALRGRPIQYAHLREPLALWDAWTSIAGPPVAFESPSAAFFIAWQDVASMHARGIDFVTLTHAAGLSSTGDPTLDRRLPLDEWYRVPSTTARAIAAARAGRRRIVAVGTTVVRAIEHAAGNGAGLRDTEGRATQRIGPHTLLRVADAIVTGTHEPGSSHHDLLRAFAADPVLDRATNALERDGYRTHEFGDSMLVFADRRPRRRDAPRTLARAA